MAGSKGAHRRPPKLEGIHREITVVFQRRSLGRCRLAGRPAVQAQSGASCAAASVQVSLSSAYPSGDYPSLNTFSVPAGSAGNSSPTVDFTIQVTRDPTNPPTS